MVKLTKRLDEYESIDEIVLDCIPRRWVTLPELSEKLAEVERRLGFVVTQDPIKAIGRLIASGKVEANKHTRSIRKR